MQDRGIDVRSGVLRERDGSWLRLRIAGLLSADTRLARKFEAVAPLNVRYQQGR